MSADKNMSASVMSKNLKRRQIKLLNRGRAKQLRIIEKLQMKAAGSRDGEDGLLRESADGQWSSPRLKQEIDAYQEFCVKCWGDVQTALEDTYKRVSILTEEIVLKEHRLEQFMLQQPEPPVKDQLTARKGGEDDLTSEQVSARRRREIVKQNAPFFMKVSQMESEISSAYTDLYECRSSILEAVNTARLICECVMNRTKQRMDVYWSAMLKKHPNPGQIPAVPELLPKSDAEITFLSHHKSLEEPVNEMLERRKRLLIQYSSDAAGRRG